MVWRLQLGRVQRITEIDHFAVLFLERFKVRGLWHFLLWHIMNCNRSQHSSAAVAHPADDFEASITTLMS